MPSLGSGALVGSWRPFVAKTAMYLATYVASSPEPAPTAALGTAEPGANWTKLGLLQGDDFTVTTSEPTKVDDRRGFSRVLFGQAVTEAGTAVFEGLVVESNPSAISDITGTSLDSITGGGQSIKVTYDTLYYKTAMLYCFNAFDNAQERYVHIPYCQAYFQLDKGENDVLVLRVQLTALQYTEGSENYLYAVGRYD